MQRDRLLTQWIEKTQVDGASTTFQMANLHAGEKRAGNEANLHRDALGISQKIADKRAKAAASTIPGSEMDAM